MTTNATYKWAIKKYGSWNKYRKWYNDNHPEQRIKDRKRNKVYRKNNKERVRFKAQLWRKRNPEKVKLYWTLNSIKKRCASWPGYVRKGIKNYLTIKDLKFLWDRDKASKMYQASIDRIDNNGHYKLSNCRFIEMEENSRKGYFESTLNPIQTQNLLDQIDKIIEEKNLGFHGSCRYLGVGFNTIKDWYSGKARIRLTTYKKLKEKFGLKEV